MSEKRIVERIAAIVITVAFFLPWAQLLGLSVSGYQLTKLGSYGNLAWLTPAGGLTLLTLNLLGSPLRRRAAVMAGLMPWAGLLVGLGKAGSELFHVLAIGAYLSLLAGAVLAIAAINEVREATPAVGGDPEKTNSTLGGFSRADDAPNALHTAETRLPTGPMSARQILEELDTPDIGGFALVGALLGGALGFVLRPAAAGVGKLPLGAVLSRGSSFEGADRLFIPAAEAAFNLLIGYAFAGAAIGGVLCWWVIRTTRARPK